MELANTLYINRTKLAEELGISVATLRNWSKQTGFPNSLPQSGKIPIYKSSEIISWLEKGGGT
jgi:predicted DNA-binding transcriptional regulator AlpA